MTGAAGDGQADGFAGWQETFVPCMIANGI
jgi:hypothetical protein